MSEIRKCTNCGHIEERSGKFCSQCGDRLPEFIAPAREKDDAPLIVTSHRIKDYQALRFVSSLIVFFGWVVIFLSIMASIYMISNYVQSGAVYNDPTLSDAPQYDPNQLFMMRPAQYLVTSFLVGFVGTMAGVFQIAMGQIFMVLLDIRDDVRTIRE